MIHMLPAPEHGLSVKTDAEIREVVRRLRKGLKDLYGDRLRGLYLFGSYARGEADYESKVDMLIMLDHVQRSSDEIGRISHLLPELSLAADVSVNSVFASEENWQNRNSPFFLNLRREAIVA